MFSKILRPARTQGSDLLHHRQIKSQYHGVRETLVGREPCRTSSANSHVEQETCQQQIKLAMLWCGGVSKISKDEIFFIHVWIVLIDLSRPCSVSFYPSWTGENPKSGRLCQAKPHRHCIKFPWYSGLDFLMFQFSLFVVRVHCCLISTLLVYVLFLCFSSCACGIPLGYVLIMEIELELQEQWICPVRTLPYRR